MGGRPGPPAGQGQPDFQLCSSSNAARAPNRALSINHRAGSSVQAEIALVMPLGQRALAPAGMPPAPPSAAARSAGSGDAAAPPPPDAAVPCGCTCEPANRWATASSVRFIQTSRQQQGLGRARQQHQLLECMHMSTLPLPLLLLPQLTHTGWRRSHSICCSLRRPKHLRMRNSWSMSDSPGNSGSRVTSSASRQPAGHGFLV